MRFLLQGQWITDSNFKAERGSPGGADAQQFSCENLRVGQPSDDPEFCVSSRFLWRLLKEERELWKCGSKDAYTLFNPKLVCFVLTSGTHIVAPISIHNRLSGSEKKREIYLVHERNKTLEGNKKSSRRKDAQKNKSPQNINERGY